MKPETKNQGLGLVEILIAVTIISFAIASLAGLGNLALRIQSQLKQNTIATFMAIEALEAGRAIKDSGWTNLTSFGVGVPLSPTKNPLFDQWALTSGSETINGFTRQIIINDVYRDGAYNIVLNGGLLDQNTKKITATVSWNSHGQDQQIILTNYLTNWQP